MKKVLCYILLAAIVLPAFAQNKKAKKLVLQQNDLQQYLAANSRLKFIRFEKYVYHDIILSPDTSLTGTYKDPYENNYDMGFLGHQYLVEKRFGKFPYERLKALLDSLTDKKCKETSFTGTITAASVTITITTHCPSNSKYPIFSKVPFDVEYPGGEKAFTKHIQAVLNQTSGFVFPGKDTVLLLKMIVRKTGSVDGVQFIDSSSAPVNEAIRSALLHTEKWTPAMQGGQWVHSYAEVFIRLRKDGTIEADYY